MRRPLRAMLALAAAATLIGAHPAPAPTILFVGNSFTFGALSAVWKYRADTVTDLNGHGVGGVPALFKLFAEQAGLDYQVSLETSPGAGLEWHWRNKAALVDRPWDHVVLQSYSTLDPEKPGDPASLITYSGRFATLFAARNPKVDISLTATWSRPDQTYKATGAWHGKPIQRMALDLRQAYDRAAAQSRPRAEVNPVGQAFNCAIAGGIADPNPYDGTSYGQVDLWAYDHYHASKFGSYLAALTVFARVTGKDPRQLGRDERAASELGIAPETAARLQTAAWQAVQGQDCGGGAKG
ncbi:DUF4886 domain-containing protein [Sphingomonas gilva]|nr:PEP-CTERM sorting domain-containing protein [Sphingomonas gilva]